MMMQMIPTTMVAMRRLRALSEWRRADSRSRAVLAFLHSLDLKIAQHPIHQQQRRHAMMFAIM